jgi:hypothetical protein
MDSNQLPPPPEPDPIDDMAEGMEKASGINLAGCGSLVIIAALVIAAVVYMTKLRDDSADPCQKAAGSIGAAADSCPAPVSSDSADDEASSESVTDSPNAEESDSEAPEDAASTDTAGNPLYGPPDEDALPPGAVLYQGSSGDQIGCITCDGASRFLSIEHPGVGVGDPARPAMEIVWKEKGQFAEFGANISGPNKGRYGYNLFANGTTYMAGCSMEIGQTSCRQQRPNDVARGDRISIIIGEGGTMVNGQVASKGNFIVDWWFVFVPA